MPKKRKKKAPQYRARCGPFDLPGGRRVYGLGFGPTKEVAEAQSIAVLPYAYFWDAQSHRASREKYKRTMEEKAAAKAEKVLREIGQLQISDPDKRAKWYYRMVGQKQAPPATPSTIMRWLRDDPKRDTR